MPRGGAAAILLSATLATTPASARAADKPTVVLVHGAFADASGFGAVTGRLQRRDYTVISPANPLRGPASDAAYVASVMRTIRGPIVLVAHSYYRHRQRRIIETIHARRQPMIPVTTFPPR